MKKIIQVSAVILTVLCMGGADSLYATDDFNNDNEDVILTILSPTNLTNAEEKDSLFDAVSSSQKGSDNLQIEDKENSLMGGSSGCCEYFKVCLGGIVSCGKNLFQIVFACS